MYSYWFGISAWFLVCQVLNACHKGMGCMCACWIKNRISVGGMFMIVAAGVVHWSCCVGCDGAGVCVGCNEYWFRCTLEFCGVVEGCVWDMDELGCAAPLEGITDES